MNNLSRYEKHLTREAKTYFNKLFLWNVKEKDIPMLNVTIGTVMDSFSAFGIYPYVKPILHEGKNLFTVVIYGIDTSNPREVYEQDLSTGDVPNKESIYDSWDLAFIAGAMMCCGMIERAKGKTRKKAEKSSQEAAAILLRLFELIRNEEQKYINDQVNKPEPHKKIFDALKSLINKENPPASN